MFIGGTNYQDGRKLGDASYYFSSYSHVWGWASWRRAWALYDFSPGSLSPGEFDSLLRRRFDTEEERSYWLWIFRKMAKGEIDTWDYQWQFSIWRAGGLSVIPNANLVSNIGAVGTHSADKKDIHINLPTSPILPLTHPATVSADRDADLRFYHGHVRAGRIGVFGRLLRRLCGPFR
jgi:hypothetical protein